MSRINQKVANEVAKALSKKKYELYEKAQKEFEVFVTEAYIKQTPTSVIECHKKYPDWVMDTRTVVFSGHGHKWTSVNTTKDVVRNSSHYATLELNAKLGGELTKLVNKANSLQAEYKTLVRELEAALNGLRTYANIEKNIPEAKKYLPPVVKHELAINFPALRKQIA